MPVLTQDNYLTIGLVAALAAAPAAVPDAAEEIPAVAAPEAPVNTLRFVSIKEVK